MPAEPITRDDLDNLAKLFLDNMRQMEERTQERIYDTQTVMLTEFHRSAPPIATRVKTTPDIDFVGGRAAGNSGAQDQVSLAENDPRTEKQGIQHKRCERKLPSWHHARQMWRGG
jgi:hypothetical protein